MGATFMRDQLDPQIYESGSTIADIALNNSAINDYIVKWDTAHKYGMSYILSVWSPPASMKANNSLDGDSLKTSSINAYVAFLTAAMLYVKNSSINSAGLPVAFSVANEPDIQTSKYPSTIYSPSTWQEVADNTRGAFNFNGLTSIESFGPETSNYDSVSSFLGGSTFPSIDGGFFDDSAIRAFAFHTYGQCSYQDVETNFVGKYPRDSWVTEFSRAFYQGSSEIANTIDMTGALGADLVLVPNNYWAWWRGYRTDTLVNMDTETLMLDNPKTNQLTVSKRFYTLRKLWQTVLPTMWYVWPFASSTDPDLRINSMDQKMCPTNLPRVDLYGFQSAGGNHESVVVVSNYTTHDKWLKVIGFPTSFTTQQAYISDTTGGDMIAQAPSTVWTPAGQTVARTVLYIPHRSVNIAILH